MTKSFLIQIFVALIISFLSEFSSIRSSSLLPSDLNPYFLLSQSFSFPPRFLHFSPLAVASSCISCVPSFDRSILPVAFRKLDKKRGLKWNISINVFVKLNKSTIAVPSTTICGSPDRPLALCSVTFTIRYATLTTDVISSLTALPPSWTK